MPICKKCGHQNREGNKHCVNCGNILELTETDIKRERSRQTTATKNWIAYFLIFIGFSTLFGGMMTYLSSLGTIIQGMTAQVAVRYVIIGFILMFIGSAILLVKTEE